MELETGLQIASLAAKVLPGIMGANQRNKAATREKEYNDKIKEIENSRQSIPNPYANIRNPYANLSVATKAADIKAEETDKALANTLDTLRATGASAGGATALAQAASKSKQDISASIEKQEQANEILKAKGEAAVQEAKAEGQKYVFEKQEERQNVLLDRYSDLANFEAMQKQQGGATALGSLSSLIGGASQFIKPGMFGTDNASAADGSGDINVGSSSGGGVVETGFTMDSSGAVGGSVTGD